MFEDVDEGLPPERPWLDASPTVTAVIVVRNGERWLQQVLGSLAGQDYRPSSVIAVDLESSDSSLQILEQHLAPTSIRSAPAATGFGDAVRVALSDSPTSEWIWLIHDDCSADGGALGYLLDEATASTDIAVVGPKIREWPSLRRLLEVGVSLMGTGRRETGLEGGEPDQGQHDRPRDVLAVSSAGMLVRRKVWDDVGGFDPALPLFCDDIDFGWRVARHGYRVRVAPRAIVFHVEASVRGSREGSAIASARREQRRSALYTLLVNASTPGFVWQWFRLLLGSLLRASGLLLAKAPREARDEAMAMVAIYRNPVAILSARRRRIASASRRPDQVRHLLPPPSLPYRHGLDAVAEVAMAIVSPTPQLSGRRAAVESGPMASEAEDLTPDTNVLVRHPWLGTLLALVVLSLVAARGLIGSGSLVGGALLPAPSSAAAWWHLFFERSHLVGVGSAAAPPPYVLALAVPATVLLGHAGLVVDVILLGAVPLAALTAHRLSRKLFESSWVQLWWSLTYASLVVASGSVAQGRIGTVVALVAAPAIVNSSLTLLRGPRLQDGIRLGLWLALATAFAPVSYVLAVVPLLVAAGLVLRRKGWPVVAVALVLPWLLLGSWMWTRALNPSQLWWEAGRADARVGVLDPSMWQLALGRAGGIGAAPAWIGIGLLVAGLLALARTDRSARVLAAWGVALVSLAVAVVGAGTTTGPSEAPAWVGLPVVCWLAGLAAAGGFAVDGARDFLAGRRLGRPVAVVAGVLALLAPVAAGVWWVAHTSGDPVERGSATDVPAYLVDRATTGQSTLVLRGTRASGVRFSLYQDDGDRLGDEAVAPDASASASLGRTVTTLLSNPAQDVIDELAGHGVRAIYLAAPADRRLADVLDAAPGLSPSGSPAGSRVWTFSSNARTPARPSSDHRPFVAGAQFLVLVLAVVAAAPGRPREEAR